MHEVNLKPDIISFGAAISACGKVGIGGTPLERARDVVAMPSSCDLGVITPKIVLSNFTP